MKKSRPNEQRSSSLSCFHIFLNFPRFSPVFSTFKHSVRNIFSLTALFPCVLSCCCVALTSFATLTARFFIKMREIVCGKVLRWVYWCFLGYIMRFFCKNLVTSASDVGERCGPIESASSTEQSFVSRLTDARVR